MSNQNQETFEFSADNKRKFDEYLTRYDDVESALLPVLHLAQEQNGWLSPAVVSKVSEMMNIADIRIREVISFYDMFYDHPVGENIIQVCTNISCSMFGGREIHAQLLDKYNVKNLVPTEDGKIMIQKMECLGACEKAPCMRVNSKYVGPLTPEQAITEVESLYE